MLAPPRTLVWHGVLRREPHWQLSEHEQQDVETLHFSACPLQIRRPIEISDVVRTATSRVPVR